MERAGLPETLRVKTRPVADMSAFISGLAKEMEGMSLPLEVAAAGPYLWVMRMPVRASLVEAGLAAK